MFVCLSVWLSQNPRVQISQNFLYMLSVAVAQSFCEDSALCCLPSVLWMKSRFHNGACTVNWRQWSSTNYPSPLPERYKLSHSWQQMLWLDGAVVGIITGRGQSLPFPTALYVYINCGNGSVRSDNAVHYACLVLWWGWGTTA